MIARPRTNKQKTKYMVNWKLKQTKQCQNCPWKVTSKLSKIPNYDRQLHEQLEDTIAKDVSLDFDKPINFMGCHNSTKNNNLECIGWLDNQLIHNNIPLRIRMLSCENSKDIKTVGEQFKTFEETF